MDFTRVNLPVVTAVMVLSGYLKSNLECLNESDSLLITDSIYFLKCDDYANKDKEGAYLCFNTVCNMFVRNGKVAGRGFVVRGDEHLK